MKKESQQYKGRLAKEYSKHFIGNDFSKIVDGNLFYDLEKLLPEYIDNMKVLDLGCGDGRLSEFMLKHGASKIIGIDISSSMIKLAKHKYSDIQFLEADFTKYKPTQVFDVLLSVFSLLYFQDLNKVISHLSKHLKEKGCFVIITNIFSSEKDIEDEIKNTYIPISLGMDEIIEIQDLYKTKKDYMNAFANSRYEIIEERYYEPQGVNIQNSFKYKNSIKLEKALFILQKT